ncbi:uncharacterized protein LOC134540403 [Bacillus rossius redtenbacheri]|uniref:uncharacterized protein LOC134540403 n=1 Tax=Bacillus rossius redtenbacheri TaxID=93214 RepID=UPI002FDDCE45
MACCFKWCLRSRKAREKSAAPSADDEAEEEEESDNDCELPPVRHMAADSPAHRHLQALAELSPPGDCSLDELLRLSEAFPLRFPPGALRCRDLLARRRSEDHLRRHANSAYPLLHEGALHLYVDYLQHKLRHGSGVERRLYEGASVADLVQRLLSRRAACYSPEADDDDSYLLVTGERGSGGWELVGTDGELPPLVLGTCLSHDEIKLSALLCVSSESDFADPAQPCGVAVGVARTRVDRPGLLDWQDVVVDDDDEAGGSSSPWRRLWSGFYGVEPRQAARRRRFSELPSGQVVDGLVLAKRVGVSAETLLLEAQHRAAVAKTKAHVHVGSRLAPQQQDVFLDAFADCLRRLSPVLSHVSDVHFAGFRERECGGVPAGGVIGGKTPDDGDEDEEEAGIRVHFCGRALPRVPDGRLLVVAYPLQGNSLPGNELWLGGGGDSSGEEAGLGLACELHNPHVNACKVSGDNLHVACARWGVLHVAEYARRKLQSLH